jgi:BirA family biotin operon repressor/biotin-[acetyl-CoA-carboxylase] ligase
LLNVKKIESEIVGSTFIEEIYYFSEMESTNSFAKTLTEKDNVLVITDYQSGGRGRFERKWISERNSSLTFTIKKHFDISSQKIQFVNFYSCVCVFLALKNFLSGQNSVKPFQLTIKWPNDIFLNQKKLSGILIENLSGKNDFTIGIGINVNQELFPEDISMSAVSLKQHLGMEIDCTELLIEIILAFDNNLELLQSKKFDKIFKLWKENNNFLGKQIIFSTVGNVERQAQIIDFHDDGGIRLRINNKDIVYYSGDIKISAANDPI